MIIPFYVFRNDPAQFRDEYLACKKVVGWRAAWIDELPNQAPAFETRFVLRYCAYPFYNEINHLLQRETGVCTMTSTKQFDYIASFNYIHDLQGLTPRTFRNGIGLDPLYKHGWVVRGAYGSLKWQWNTSMRAKNVRETIEIGHLVRQTTQSDDYYVREYAPLKTLEEGVNGLPFSEEYRIIFCRGQIVASGHYWRQIMDDQSLAKEKPPKEAVDIAYQALNLLRDPNQWVSIDVAQTMKGDWIVIECNTGEQSGLNGIDAIDYYTNLDRILTQ
jgi:hypothetical protein